jgi:hypothetical protein
MLIRLVCSHLRQCQTRCKVLVQAAALAVEAVAPTIFYRKPVFAHTADKEASAKTAGAAVYARTEGKEALVKTAGAAVFAHTAGKDALAKTAGAAVFARTAG